MPEQAAGRGLARDLRSMVGEAGLVVGRGLGPYTHDSTVQRGLRGKPLVAVRPATAEQASAVVAYCYRQGLPIVPRGGGTGLSGGATPPEGAVVISAERLRRIRSFVPTARQLTVEAGVPTAAVARLARGEGLLFGPDPGASTQSQIGGNVATNAGGPHAYKYGRTGRYVGGLEAVFAPGELLALGGERGLTGDGYDLVSLLVGSEGTLAFLTAVTLTFLPAPAARQAGAILFASPAEAGRFLVALREGGLQPAVLDFADGATVAMAAAAFPLPVVAQAVRGKARAKAPVVLLFELDGAADEEVAGAVAQLEELVGEHEPLAFGCCSATALWRWRDGLGPLVAAELGGRVNDDFYIPPERFAEALGAVQAIGHRQAVPVRVWGHAGDGVFHASFLAQPGGEEWGRAVSAAEEALRLALRLGGLLSGEHGIGLVKRDLYAATAAPARIAREVALKRALDPSWLINPGTKLPPHPQPAAALPVKSGSESRHAAGV